MVFAVRPAWFGVLLLGLAASTGCNSPYHADRGALAGGLLGAGTGALVGDALGNAGAGALVGAGVGALTGGAIGAGIDESEARNRALIEQRLGQTVAAGAVTVNDVIMMSQAGVSEELIVNHVRAHGMVAPLTTDDLIRLQQAGVGAAAITTMQATPQPVAVVQAAAPPPPVVVEEYYYGPGYCGPWYHGYYHDRHHGRGGFHWGVSFAGR